MSAITGMLADQLAFCKEQTIKIAAGVPVESRFTQLKDGKAHPLWLLGHLANTANVVMLQWALNGENVTPKGFGRKFAPDFGGGDPVTTDPSAYPAWDEVVAVYERALTAAIDGVRKLDDSTLADPLPGRIPEPLRVHFSSIGVTLNIMVSHDSYHRGQMGMLSALHK